MRVEQRTSDRPAELKGLILKQQDVAAKLARAGKQEQARAARAKLLMLLNQLDLSRSLPDEDHSQNGSVQEQLQPEVEQQAMN